MLKTLIPAGAFFMLSSDESSHYKGINTFYKMSEFYTVWKIWLFEFVGLNAFQ